MIKIHVSIRIPAKGQLNIMYLEQLGELLSPLRIIFLTLNIKYEKLLANIWTTCNILDSVKG